MIILESLMIILLVCICIYATISDIKYGIIENKILATVTICATPLILIYYSIYSKLIIEFLVNVLVIILLSLLLFITHTWAGGDCKLLFVLALLYPARFYIGYPGTKYTLAFTVCIAFLSGYIYLIIDAIAKFIKRKPAICNSIKSSRMKYKLRSFIYSYFTLFIYISAIHLIYLLFISKIVHLNLLVLSAIYFLIGVLLRRVTITQNKSLSIIIFIITVFVSALTEVLPVSTDYIMYIIVIILAAVSILISENNYEVIPTSAIKKGHILSASTTALFVNSNVKGLPEMSTEDLKSRLTEDEVAGVINWEKSKFGQSTVTIVKKIPFAIFIGIGFIVYFILRGVQ